ncbi:hypothetical protein [Candidatus Nitrosotenuis aquarius]|uniref:hypothetical protein n=1 Tax=Candidatus Nitrosotenuis aquarius TaxID=1846278 RepID=UPI000C1F29D4|nr:hypothetical protein [Candidatus Nitrosotenuis aquarius]
MSKTIQEVAQKELWVLVSQLKENASNSELERIAPQVLSIIDQWSDSGKFIWSGPFGDNTGGMAVFEATQEQANQFAKNYGDIVSGVLNYYIYKWDVLWGSK